MSILLILMSLFVLSVLIFIHEFGHYIVGKKSGIGVKEFAVGFGPKIFAREKNGTIYSIRAIPLGGFTAFEGEDEDSESETAMNNVSIWKRMATVFAGPLFNIVTGILLTTILLMSQGEITSMVTDLVEGGNAQQYGLEVGDVIIDINGRSTYFSSEVSSQLYLQNNKGVNAVVTAMRGDQKVTTEIPFNEDGTIGIYMGNIEKYSLIDAVSKSFRYGYSIMYDTFASLKGMATGTQPMEDMGGAVAIVGMLGLAIKQGVFSLLRIGALISFSLGIMNLLPIPALDGGRLVFYIYEAIVGKPLNREIEAKIHFIGFALLFGFMLFMIYNDVINIFVR